MAGEPTPPATSGSSRRRGAVLEEAILRAAADELLESGYPGLTMDRVAKRAGTNKNAIYRRWPNRAALGVAAYRRLVTARTQPPDTGELREDALTLLRRINCDLSSPEGEILRSLLSSVGDEPELLAELQEQAADGGSAAWLTILGRAVARGEAPPEAVHPRVATVALNEVYLPLIRGRGPASAPVSRAGGRLP